MDLQRGEAVLSRLEKEAENVAAVGELSKHLQTVRSDLNDAVSDVQSLAKQLSQTNSTLVESTEVIQQRLASLQEELARLSRDIDDRVRTQIDRATTHYETVLRGELRSVIDRIELNLREEKQIIQEAAEKLTLRQETLSEEIKRDLKAKFYWTAILILASAAAGSVSAILLIGR